MKKVETIKKKKIFFCDPQIKKGIQVWNDMRVSKCVSFNFSLILG